MDEMKTAYDENGIPYLVEAEGSEAKHIIELLIAEAQGRLVVMMPQDEFDNRLSKLCSENWKVNSLCRDCGGVPKHLEDNLFAMLGVKRAPTGYIDTRSESALKAGEADGRGGAV